MSLKSNPIALLPTLLTLGNVVCGFGAITIAAKLGPDSIDVSPNTLTTAGALIFLAMLFDALDGSAARLTKATSDIGAQLDSLCDAISFGLAPAFLMLQFVRFEDSLAGQYADWFAWPGRLLWTIAALYVVCAVLRLARFNVETEEDDAHDGFSGLPSPAAAAAIAGFPLAMRELIRLEEADAARVAFLVPALKAVLPIVAFGVAVLMVSRLPYVHVFSKLTQKNRNRRDVISIVFSVAAVFLMHELAIVVLAVGFALSAPALWLWTDYAQPLLRRAPKDDGTAPKADPPHATRGPSRVSHPEPRRDD